AGVPLDSPGRVARVLVALGRRARPTDSFSVVDVLGTPALRVARAPPLPSRWAPVSVLVPVIDVSGRIAAIYNMLDEGKLTSWPGPTGA
ncbi:MAG TPA: hypothetical protein PKA64_03380, partial [Myxococcota bacterium]|nr:hypothetical protein [Myxococcota bacterium]